MPDAAQQHFHAEIKLFLEGLEKSVYMNEK